MYARVNACDGGRTMCISLIAYVFYNGVKTRYFCFMVFIQIAVFGVLSTFILHWTGFTVFNRLSWTRNIYENNNMNIRIHETETLRNFYYKPERSKALFVWKSGSVVPVKASTVLFGDTEKNLMQQRICEKSKNLKRYNTTSKQGITDCRALRREIDEVNAYVFKEELDMPIAFSILVFTDYEMIELLLRTIYKHHNTYCIHIDAKSSNCFKNRVVKLAKCFDNVIVATKLVRVFWGAFSIVEAEIACMTELLNKTRTWKYFINLTGQEFPLRTNYEITKILGALRGFNNIRCSKKSLKNFLLRKAGPPPFNLSVYKSATHVVLSRKFVTYLLNDKRAQAVINWARNVIVPDEMLFPVLNCNRKLRAPGSPSDPSLFAVEKNFISRFKVWRNKTAQCHGKLSRDICIFGSRDIDTLQARHELFANKFHIKSFPEVPYCLRSILLKRTILQYKGYLDFNVSFYNNIPYKL